ncbi:MAG: N-acetylneuraminate synthase family protein [Thermoleophilaceae bacterium]|nr:N-acetylneuraminate synthase family protein [Thermoleophilaceae bacterium]
MSGVSVAGREIAAGGDPYVIAEAGVNHNGDLAIALALIEAAAEAGADAVKFQTFSAEAIATDAAAAADYAGGGTQRALLRGLELPPGAWPQLRDAAEAAGLAFLSTPFDSSAVATLTELGVPALKISSGDLTNTPLLREAAATGVPVILSTGMSTLEEVERALADLGPAEVVLLHCLSAYPAPMQELNLAAIPLLAERFGRPVGFSDHTEGRAACVAAIALGACCIEKHLTLDRTAEGPDHAASMEPDLFALLVRDVHEAHAAIGRAEKARQPSEENTAQVARRSLVAARELEAGTVLTAEDLAAQRPAGGIEPTAIDEVAGRTLIRALGAGEQLAAEDLE